MYKIQTFTHYFINDLLYILFLWIIDFSS